ncbi:hypothetical protein OI18_05830 [Flavihumibacter solisilvae]|uniref:Uncharacterized protein n=1 Tax=Flavihumibacter solisilvae TaxID=1349421 RepID=A0A0C1L7C6_9BACT|nr:hypothetical protein OI18_05830 [Flavihumibacter solisilvae]
MIAIRGESRTMDAKRPNIPTKQAIQGSRISVAFAGRFTDNFVRLASFAIDKGPAAVVLLEKKVWAKNHLKKCSS